MALCFCAYGTFEIPSSQARNEELARKSAKASEEDIQQLTEEYEVRLGAAERKVYALTKERDMLKRGTEKLSSATDLLKEKDNIIAQVGMWNLLGRKHSNIIVETGLWGAYG